MHDPQTIRQLIHPVSTIALSELLTDVHDELSVVAYNHLDVTYGDADYTLIAIETFRNLYDLANGPLQAALERLDVDDPEEKAIHERILADRKILLALCDALGENVFVDLEH